jgi:type I restriction enzyme S subunit
MTDAKEWCEASLGSVATLQRGFDLPARKRVNGKIPIVSSSGISGWHDRAMVTAPGVVTGRYGTIGQVFFLGRDFWPLNTTLWVSSFHGNDPMFVYYLLQRVDFATHSGKSGVPGVNRNDLHTEEVRVPSSCAEQHRIAVALSDIDALIATLERLIAKRQAIKQGMMQQLLTGGARFPRFDTAWRPGRLGDIAEVIMGQSPVGASYNTDRIGAPLINGPTEFTRRYPVAKQWTTAPVRFCRPEDVLICVRGSSTGRTNLADAEYCIGRGVAAVRARGKNYQRFVSYALSAVVEELLKLQTGSTFPSIDSRVIRGGKVLIPEPAEQRALADALHDIDELVTILKQLITKQRAIKQGMMQQLLTGRTRLPVAETAA